MSPPVFKVVGTSHALVPTSLVDQEQVISQIIGKIQLFHLISEIFPKKKVPPAQTLLVFSIFTVWKPHRPLTFHDGIVLHQHQQNQHLFVPTNLKNVPALLFK